MPEPIEFYFDFSSPYGYLASTRIDDLAARNGRQVVWHPYLMGALFKITGRQPLANHPLVREYAYLDLRRTARLYDIPFVLPEKFPIVTANPCRAFYWLHDRDEGAAVQLAKALYDAYFAQGRDISSIEETLAVAGRIGVDTSLLGPALKSPELKERLRKVVESAIERDVFGSPYLLVEGEPFWGVDHLDQVERWLQTGGW